MKRTCNGCRALQYPQGALFLNRCELGYRTVTKDRATVPDEECPKPRTIREFVDAPKKIECPDI